MRVVVILWLVVLTAGLVIAEFGGAESRRIAVEAYERADGAYRVVTAHIAGKPPLLESHRAHAAAINWCVAKIDSMRQAGKNVGE